MRTAAVVGANGLLGRAVMARLASEAPAWQACGLDLPDVDITRAASLNGCSALARAESIINCAGYTDVEGAEADEGRAWQVNGEAVANLALLARRRGRLLVHVSTDFVFDGIRGAPYPPEAEPRPLSAYGRSKLAGEWALAGSGGRWCLVRSSWLFGRGGRNFVATILDRARSGGRLAVVADQIGSPTHVADLADALVELASREATGVYHCANAGACSWHELACEALRLSGLPADVEAISTAEAERRFDLRAKRPAYSALDCGSLAALLGRPMRPWQEALADYLGGRALACP